VAPPEVLEVSYAGAKLSRTLCELQTKDPKMGIAYC